MPYIKPNLWSFYLEGRDARLLQCDDVHDEIIASEHSMLRACQEVAESNAAHLKTGRIKRKWAEEHAADIKEAKVTDDEAFDAWVSGRVDKLAVKLQKRTLDELYDDYTDGASSDGEEEKSDEDDDETDD